MIWFVAAALAANLSLQTTAPVTLSVDGASWITLTVPGSATVAVAAGEHTLRVDVGGRRFEGTFEAQPGAGEAVIVVASADAVTVQGTPLAAPASGDRAVRVSVVGVVPLMVVVDAARHVVAPGAGTLLTLTPGSHPVSVRSADGAEVYARGELVVGLGAGEAALQLHEGRLPTAGGEGLDFVTRR